MSESESPQWSPAVEAGKSRVCTRGLRPAVWGRNGARPLRPGRELAEIIACDLQRRGGLRAVARQGVEDARSDVATRRKTAPDLRASAPRGWSRHLTARRGRGEWWGKGTGLVCRSAVVASVFGF